MGRGDVPGRHDNGSTGPQTPEAPEMRNSGEYLFQLPPDEEFLKYVKPAQLEEAKERFSKQIDEAVIRHLVDLLNESEIDQMIEDQGGGGGMETSGSFPALPGGELSMDRVQKLQARHTVLKTARAILREKHFSSVDLGQMKELFHIDPQDERGREIIGAIQARMQPTFHREFVNTCEAVAYKSIDQYDDKTEAYNDKGIRRFAAGTIDYFTQHGEEDECVAIVYFDVNDFRAVNKEIGHVRADALFVQIVAALKTTLRGTDGIARTGGDEFALVLPTKKDAVDEVMRRIEEAIAKIKSDEKKLLETKGLTLAVAGGIYVIDQSTENPSYDAAIARAEEASYLQKLEGHGFQPYDPETLERLADHILRDKEKRIEFARAVAKHEFSRKYKEAQKMLRDCPAEMKDDAEKLLFHIDRQIEEEIEAVQVRIRLARNNAGDLPALYEMFRPKLVIEKEEEA